MVYVITAYEAKFNSSFISAIRNSSPWLESTMAVILNALVESFFALTCSDNWRLMKLVSHLTALA